MLFSVILKRKQKIVWTQSLNGKYKVRRANIWMLIILLKCVLFVLIEKRQPVCDIKSLSYIKSVCPFHNLGYETTTLTCNCLAIGRLKIKALLPNNAAKCVCVPKFYFQLWPNFISFRVDQNLIFLFFLWRISSVWRVGRKSRSAQILSIAYNHKRRSFEVKTHMSWSIKFYHFFNKNRTTRQSSLWFCLPKKGDHFLFIIVVVNGLIFV